MDIVRGCNHCCIQLGVGVGGNHWWIWSESVTIWIRLWGCCHCLIRSGVVGAVG